MLYASFGLLVLMLHLITNFELIRNGRNGLSESIIQYRRFLFGVIIYLISDILWGIFYQEKMITLVYADTIAYFLTMAASVYIWIRFVTAHLGKKSILAEGLNIVAVLLLAYELITLILNFFAPIVFYFDKACNYFPLWSRNVYFMIQILLFLAVSGYSFLIALETSDKVRRHHITIAVSGIVIAVFVLLQITNPLLPYYATGCLIATCLVNSFVSQDLRIENARKLGSAIQMQKELEERVKLKDQLLSQEILRHQSDAMITAMSAEYRSVYYVDLDTNESLCYRAGQQQRDGIQEGATFPYRQMFQNYAERYVNREYRDGFLEFIDPENIRKRLAKEPVIAYRFLCTTGGQEHYEMLRISRVSRADEGQDTCISAVGMGFSDVDRETREAMEMDHALSDALNQAEEANAAKTSFLSSMSHEIRTPMNAIIGFDTIALKDLSIPDTTREYLEKIGASAKHLLNLINDILDMSRIESGRMTLRSEGFSFSEILDQINSMIQGQCQEKGLTYSYQIGKNVADYYIGDDMKLKQVLINILGNAVKYTPAPGQISFDVDQTAEYDGNAVLRFIIKDTGVGMDKEFIPKVFSAFTQENEGQATTYGSTGLGMAISKSIVEMMNGRISVESEKGAGSTFTVTVTLKTTDRIDDGSPEGVRPQDLRVLVIDDDELSCFQVQGVLDEVGIFSDSCHSSRQAQEILTLTHARQEAFDLILVDRHMSGQDGLSVARMIREQYDKDAAIFLLTYYDWSDIEAAAAEAGIDGFLSKPLSVAEVLDKFKKVIRDRKMGQKVHKKADLTGRHILLAEDMEINAEIMKQLLDMHEMEVDLAENGQVCVDMFKEKEPGTYDAILMDIRMPVLDGLGAAEAIRALDRPDAKKIPIIAMTANAFDKDVQLSLQAGMDAHLTKPVDANHLIETLETLIED